ELPMSAARTLFESATENRPVADLCDGRARLLAHHGVLQFAAGAAATGRPVAAICIAYACPVPENDIGIRNTLVVRNVGSRHHAVAEIVVAAIGIFVVDEEAPDHVDRVKTPAGLVGGIVVTGS